MKKSNQILEELIERYPQLATCKADIVESCKILLHSIKSDKKILLCGNGGSSADCDHISGELLKGFLLKRRLNETDSKKFEKYNSDKLAAKLQYGICAIPLHDMTAVFTAYCNDVDPASVFAQLVFAIGKTDDSLICISTSGNAENVYKAAVTAKVCGLRVIALTGQNESKLSGIADVCIKVPESETFKIQELHLPVYHAICAVLENEMYGDE